MAAALGTAGSLGGIPYPVYAPGSGGVPGTTDSGAGGIGMAHTLGLSVPIVTQPPGGVPGTTDSGPAAPGMAHTLTSSPGQAGGKGPRYGYNPNDFSGGQQPFSPHPYVAPPAVPPTPPPKPVAPGLGGGAGFGPGTTPVPNSAPGGITVPKSPTTPPKVTTGGPNPATPIPNTSGTPGGGLSGGQQTAPAIGLPTGYNLGQGVDTSLSGLLPTGFSTGTLQGAPIPDAAVNPVSDYYNPVVANEQGPTAWNVTPDQTVQGQYSNLMKAGNPAIQAAEQAVLRQHAASGGGNDLMAQTAAATAGSQVALQIATQDAQTKAQAGQFNANAANQFAAQLNSFTENMMSSRQNFDQGVSMLHNQVNANIEQLYSQIQGSAATESINLKGQLQSAQISINSTLEQMDKTFSQNVAMAGVNEQFKNSDEWTQFGMQVRSSYLSNVTTQTTALMQTIAAINANPNINSTQAAAGIKSAVSQFNADMTLANSYYSSMVPGSTTADYTTYDPSSFPNEILSGGSSG